MRVYCGVCETFFPEGSARYTDPNVRAADGSALLCHPSCYAEGTGQITRGERQQELAAGRELFLRRGRNAAALVAFAGRAPAGGLLGTIIRYRLAPDAAAGRLVEVNSDYAIYPD